MTGNVLVAGAGPTGLLLACELALAGVPVTVVERRTAIAEMSQGMAIHGRSMQLLASRGLAERISPEETFPWPRTPFSMMWLNLETVSELDFTIAYPQWRTERLLEGRAAELGVDLRRGVELTGVRQDADGVTVTVRTGTGEDELRAGYLVACDGRDSTVRRLTEVPTTGSAPGYFGVLADVDASEGGGNLMFEAGLYPTGLFGALPIDGSTLRLMTVEFGERPEPATDEVTVDELRAAIGRVLGKEPDIAQTRWLSRFAGATRLATTFRQQRILFAGDAARTLFFSGTQGLHAGLEDALNLGWKLAASVKATAPERLLDTYHDERHGASERLRMHADSVQALMHPLERIGELRELVGELLQFDDVNRFLLQLPTHSRYEMPGMPAHPLLGTRVPDIELTTPDGEISLARTLHDGRAVLVDLSGGTLTPQALAGWADRLRVVSAEPVADLAATCLLIRPDGCVAYAAEAAADTELLRAALTHWLGGPITED